jgi:predicted MFS family arabinose efflux permease
MRPERRLVIASLLAPAETLVKTTDPTQPRENAAPLALQIGLFTITRTVINTGFRMMYPFLPAIARGLGVDLGTAALIVTARSTVGLVTPVLGSAADVWGRRTTILIALAVTALAMAAVFAWPIFPVVLVAVVAASAAKMVFEPAMWAYVSDRIDYARRGMALAITEIGWSSAYLVGIPLVGLSIAQGGWTAPFPWLAGIALIALLVIRVMMPRDTPSAAAERPSFVKNARIVLSHRPALAAMAMAMLITVANENIGIVFGKLLEDSFNLKVAEIGFAATVIGISELSGEGLVAAFVDRLGKRRSIIIGIGANLVVSLALPWVVQTLVGALVGLFLFYLTFEISVVSIIPMMTELVPDARATMLAGNAAAFSLGRAIGSLLGPVLYGYGLMVGGITAVVLDAVAIALLILFVHVDERAASA